MPSETLTIGQPAPDFTLKDEQNQDVTLSDLKGQTVALVFFPFAFSPNCEREMCEIRDMWSDFEETDAQVFGISRDSVWTLKAWKEAKGLKQRFLADLKGDVARQYGAWNEAAARAERKTVVIDKDGNVAWTDQTENAGKTRNQRDAITALAGVR